MDRKNKKDHQRESRERGNARPRYDGGVDEHIATPVAIRSALSSSIHSPPPNRLSSSPMREPYGPPSGGLAGSPSPGFGHPRSPGLFASSPSRPSPLSGGRPSVPGPLTLKSAQSPLRPPPTTAFSSSFSHVVPAVDRSGPPLSASFADNTLRKSIWARSETPDEPLSPARRPAQPRRPRTAIDVFHDDDSYDHGEDLLPSSLSDLLTPTERTRRKSRRDSGDSVSPSRGGALLNAPFSGERLAQSAGATMGPPGFLQGLWSAEGVDARKSENNEEDFAFGPTTAQPQTRHSLLTEQRSPVSSKRPSREPLVAVEGPFLIRQPSDPHSPSARALQEHAPGQSLPGGLANALSRLHLHGPRPPSGLAHATQGGEEVLSGAETPPMGSGPSTGRTEEHEEEALFAMDG
jgi:cleavage and polyadenylation specificity factor subunit 4